MRLRLASVFLVLALAGCSGFSSAMRHGDDAMSRHDYDAAVKAYTRAVKIDGADKTAQQRLAEAQDAAVGTRLDGARQALAAGDLIGAASATADAEKILPGDPAVAALADQVLDSVVLTGQAQVQQHHFDTARALFHDATPLLPDPSARIVKADRAALDAWLAALTSGRDAAVKANRQADGLLQERMIIQLAPSAVERARCTRMSNELRAKHEVVLAQKMLVDALPPERGARPSRGSETPEQRFSALSRGVAGVRPSQWLRVTTPDEKLKAVATINSTQGDTRIADRHERESRTQQYQAGVRQRPNPDFARAVDAEREAQRRDDRAQRDYDLATTRLGQAQAAVDAEGPSPDSETPAERALADAQRQLDHTRGDLERSHDELFARQQTRVNTPERFEEPVVETLVYEVMHHSVRASATLATAVDRGNKKGAFSTWPLLIQASDESHAAQPAIGLPADPIELPNDKALYAGINDQALQALERVIQDTFAGAVADQRNKAMALDGDARVEQLVTYLLMDQAITDKETDALLYEVRGIPAASLLLDDCGQPE